MSKDYYTTMGLKRAATEDDIKRAYRKLARKYHPDVSKEANAEEKFKELGEAYEVLKDAEKRKAYDQFGKDWEAGQQYKKQADAQHSAGFRPGAGAGDAEDIFESLFGGGFGSKYTRNRKYSVAGEDQHGKMSISLEEAFHGGEKNIQIPTQTMDPYGHMSSTTRMLKVKIPAGIKEGQSIRLLGQGSPGVGTGPKGDLYLEINILKHTLFDLIGKDVYLTLPITPWEAALGANIETRTLNGKINLKIPPDSQAGQKLRIKGRGLSGTIPGDQYVVLKIVIPLPTTASGKNLYEKMAEEMPFNPRISQGG